MTVPEGWLDVVTFNRNREAFPAEELAKYRGPHVAWSLDGTRIVADGATYEAMRDRLRESGVDPRCVVDSFIPDPDVSYV